MVKKLTVHITLSLWAFISLMMAPAAGIHAQVKPDMTWFKEAKFGLFLHWGLYSETAGDWNGRPTRGGEHFMLYERIPVKTYATIADRFNPVGFDADAWVKQAKSAGMKYIVYTAKHHDGFAMYRSEVSDYNIVKKTPYQKDPLAALAEACRKYDLKLCLYYSLGRDWEDPDVPTNWPVKAGRSNTWDFPDEDAKVFNRYFERKVKPQIRELLTHYGPIGVLWFDTPELISKKESAELRSLVTQLQPQCLVNSRIGGGYGDFSISEQTLDPSSKKAWESCMTIGNNWGYNRHDSTWKSSEMLVRNLINVVANHGNLLLNVGPMGNGEFPDWAVKRLDTIGEWMKKNGEAITGTSPYIVTFEGYRKEEIRADDQNTMKDAVHDATPKTTLPDVFYTTKGKVVYALLRSWKMPSVTLASLKGKQVRSVKLLGSSKKVKQVQTADGLEVTLPAGFEKVNRIPVYTLKIELE